MTYTFRFYHVLHRTHLSIVVRARTFDLAREGAEACLLAKEGRQERERYILRGWTLDPDGEACCG